jgi:putative transposase
MEENFLQGEEGHTGAVGKTLGAALKHKEHLLSFAELDAKIGDWIQNEYHQRVHSETGRKPIELWHESVQLRLPASERELDLLLMKANQTRKVRNVGIDFTWQKQSGRYWHPALAALYGATVTIRFSPDDLSSLLLYSTTTGEFLCQAFRQGDTSFPFTAADFRNARRTEAARQRSQRQRSIASVRAQQKRLVVPTTTATKQAALLDAPSVEADRLFAQMVAEMEGENR